MLCLRNLEKPVRTKNSARPIQCLTLQLYFFINCFISLVESFCRNWFSSAKELILFSSFAHTFTSFKLIVKNVMHKVLGLKVMALMNTGYVINRYGLLHLNQCCFQVWSTLIQHICGPSQILINNEKVLLGDQRTWWFALLFQFPLQPITTRQNTQHCNSTHQMYTNRIFREIFTGLKHMVKEHWERKWD